MALKKVAVGLKRRGELSRRIWFDGDPLRRRKPHIFLDSEENASTQTRTLVESELLLRPPPQQGPRGVEPNRQHKKIS